MFKYKWPCDAFFEVLIYLSFRVFLKFLCERRIPKMTQNHQTPTTPHSPPVIDDEDAAVGARDLLDTDQSLGIVGEGVGLLACRA